VKTLLANLAIWYLRKKKKSVLIGYELDENKIRCLSNSAYIYDSNINNVSYLCKDGTPFDIPTGKFNVNVPMKEGGIN
jgi:hypothetical protein